MLRNRQVSRAPRRRHHLPAWSFVLLCASLLSSATSLAQGRAYVANSTGRSITVLDTDTRSVAGSIPLAAAPSRVTIDADGARAYVSHASANSITVIDTMTRVVLRTIPVGVGPASLAITPDGRHLYVVIAGGTVQVVDLGDDSIVRTIAIGGDGGQIAITPDGTRAYVSNGSLAVIDTATFAVAGTGYTGWSANTLAISPDGARVYVPTIHFDTSSGFSASGSVEVLDVATDQVVARIGTGSLPGPIALSPDGAQAYVGLASTWVNTGYGAGFLPARAIVIVDTATLATRWLATANTPSSVAVARDGGTALVAIRLANSLAMVDAATRTVASSVPTAASPVDVVAFELPSASFTTFASGCGGAVPVELAAASGSLPRVGSLFELQATGVEPGAAVWLAIGDALLAPLDLASIGAPGCHLAVTPFATLSAVAGAAGATWQLPVPASMPYVGISFQAIGGAPAANPLGLVTSNGGTARFGS